ncbi:MAG: hypothetical protein KatS3mg050_2646 [Litorilinea sp.]|nr:MAG: hypothetical protein KatS3mg050_2646 [Litorilinea sp.]
MAWTRILGRRVHRRSGWMVVVLGAALLLSGCGLLFGGAGPEPTPTPRRELVPTFTPTPADAAPAQEPAAPAVAQQEAPPTPVPTATPRPDEPTPEPPPAVPTDTPTPTPAPALPKLTVLIEAANVRNGPGTSYGLVGAVTRDQQFDIVARNPEGTWWQFCCVNGQQGWIFGDLVRVENGDNVPVAENIPTPPPVVAAPPPTDTPAPAAAPPPAADPCANIGGDGCKFKVREGPKFGNNGGMELKLQLFFIHSGIDGGQPQGSYFVVLIKDGVKLPIGDHVRSIALNKSDGPLGPYNYEYKLGLDQLPGNTVAGNYVMYVLDGNGERDSQDFAFSVPEGQGEIWLVWDQG